MAKTTRSLALRWAPMPLGLLLGVVAVELALRLVGAVWLEDRSGAGEEGAPVDGLSIVCLGDSNTYGLYETAETSYPGRLQVLLDERAPARRHRVANLAVPGSSSEEVLQRVPEALERYAPDLVLVLAGINDRWSVAERGGGVAVRPWWQDLRVVKLAQIVGQRAAEPDEVVSLQKEGDRFVRAGRDRTGQRVEYWQKGEGEFLAPADAAVRVEANLREIRSLCRDAGARLVLLTYAWDASHLGKANQVLRSSADDLGVELVDCAQVLAESIEEFGADALFYPDRHPKALGYRLVARAVFNALAGRGWIPGDAAPIDDLAAGLQTSGGKLEVTRRHGVLGLAVSGEVPGRRVQVLLSFDGPGRKVRWFETVLPLVEDALYTASTTHASLGAVTNPSGGAFVSLEPLKKLLQVREGAVRDVRALYVVPRNAIEDVAYISASVVVPRADLLGG